MIQEEFVKKFCPDYEKKIKIVSLDTVPSIEDEMFNDALLAFARRLCEAQKEICAKDARLFLSFSSFPTPVKIEEVVKNSTTPNLSDL